MLTRNDWLEMWDSVKMIESHARELEANTYGLTPISRTLHDYNCKQIMFLVEQMKKQIELELEIK